MSTHAPDQTALAKAEILTEALPYIQRYAGQTFVVKYGGHAMGDPEAARNFAEDIVLLKAVGINPIVVHGGGPQIGRMLKQLGIESKFVGGLRVTDKETAYVAEMVLSGAINKELVGWIMQAGGQAVGLSGKDAGLVTARKIEGREADPNRGIERNVDIGFVGEPVAVNPAILETLTQMLGDFAVTGFAPYAEAWNAHNLWQGQPVEIREDNKVLLQGRCEGVAVSGALRVSTPSSVEEVISGDVSLRRV